MTEPKSAFADPKLDAAADAETEYKGLEALKTLIKGMGPKDHAYLQFVAYSEVIRQGKDVNRDLQNDFGDAVFGVMQNLITISLVKLLLQAADREGALDANNRGFQMMAMAYKASREAYDKNQANMAKLALRFEEEMETSKIGG